ncbi:hypothetical protein AVEN_44751-1 [Araneus ventricosus]|uniref:Cuticle protein 10.9 n=1 Tax=Araneus ventricosus TaxID=182803 RepID=A0A4Y2HR07_ARAVE|nr:hypothetical protein AVEN_44751-1 [Araneus ventricosus]
MAIVGQAAGAKGENRRNFANYGASSVNDGAGGTSSATVEGGLSARYGGGSSFTSTGSRGTASLRGLSGGFGQNEAPKSYNFDYKSTDEQGNTHYHREEADASGTVRGSYGYTDVQGLYRAVDYIADASGYRASIRTNEPGTDGKESPADVQMTVEQHSAGIRDRYAPFGTGDPSRRGASDPGLFGPRSLEQQPKMVRTSLETVIKEGFVSGIKCTHSIGDEEDECT